MHPTQIKQKPHRPIISDYSNIEIRMITPLRLKISVSRNRPNQPLRRKQPVLPPTCGQFLSQLGLKSKSEKVTADSSARASPGFVMPVRRQRTCSIGSTITENTCSMLSPLSPNRIATRINPLFVVSEQSEPMEQSEPLEQSEDDTTIGSEDNDAIDDILDIDLTSPLGQKLSPALAEHQWEGMGVITNYDQYCNQLPSTSEESRALRSKTPYCKLQFLP